MGVGARFLCRLRLEASEPEPPAPPDGTHPRLILNATGMQTLHTTITNNSTLRSRWQTFITEFETGSGSPWLNTPCLDFYSLAFAAFCCNLRQYGEIPGLTFQTTRAVMLDKVLEGAFNEAIATLGLAEIASYGSGMAMIYDNIYDEMTESQRSQYETLLRHSVAFSRYASTDSHWESGMGREHLGQLMCRLALPEFEGSIVTAYNETVSWADSQDWLQYGQGSGYEWSDDGGRQSACMLCLYILQNFGYTAAQTTDHYLTVLRDNWQQARRFVIPHPSNASAGSKNFNDRTHQQEATNFKNIGLNVGALALWAKAYLPGKVVLDGQNIASTANLANNETDFLAYLQYEWTRPVPGAPTRSLKKVMNGAGMRLDAGMGPNHGGRFCFYSWPAWLILNVSEPTGKDPVTAGIPKVRRFSPGTCDHTIINSDLGSTIDTTSSQISYYFRKYKTEDYATGVHGNGMWHAHRAGPLFITRGCDESHEPVNRRCTWGYNGCVTFIDPNEWPEMMTPVSVAGTLNQIGDGGGVRHGPGTLFTKADVLGNPDANYGDVTHWYADTEVVAITTDMARSYNGAAVQYGTPTHNQPKINSFTREWVCIQRGGDGSDHERIFTYDRIHLTDTKFIPHYHICPGPPQVTIDGTEAAFIWAGTDDTSLIRDGNPTFAWTAATANHWEYTDATYIEVDNTTEPTGNTPMGQGKARVTPLRPSGSDLLIKKSGGTAADCATATFDGSPFYNEYGGWMGEPWRSSREASTAFRAYSGLYGVALCPSGTPTSEFNYLVVTDMMSSSDTADTVEELSCDSQSVAARCGETVVVFAVDGPRDSGFVDIPDNVTLVVVVNRPSGVLTFDVSEAGRVNF